MSADISQILKEARGVFVGRATQKMSSTVTSTGRVLFAVLCGLLSLYTSYLKGNQKSNSEESGQS